MSEIAPALHEPWPDMARQRQGVSFGMWIFIASELLFFGGLFLAFPAILPASLTLIEEKEGRRQAEGDAVGAIIGAVGLVVFALIAYVLFTRVPGGSVEAIALAAWLGVSILLYLLVRRLFR